MRTLLSFLFSTLLIINVSAQQAPRGMTEHSPLSGSFVCTGQAEEFQVGASTAAAGAEALFHARAMEDWTVQDSVVFDTYVPARGYTGVRFNRKDRRLCRAQKQGR